VTVAGPPPHHPQPHTLTHATPRSSENLNPGAESARPGHGKAQQRRSPGTERPTPAEAPGAARWNGQPRWFYPRTAAP